MERRPMLPARALVAAAWCLLVLAGQIAAADIQIEFHSIDIERYPHVSVLCDVFDPSGRALRGLTSRHFRVLENAMRCRVVDVSVDVTPLSVVLCLDSSGSMVNAINHLRLAASQFVRLMDPQDEVLLIDFDNEPRVISRFTNDAERLVAAIGTLEAYGATSFYDAVYKAVLEVRARSGRRAVIAMTDGQDQNASGTARLSRHTLAEVVDFARTENVPVYTVGLGKFTDAKVLEKIARAADGTYAHAPLGQDLEQLYVKIARNLKSRVRLAFRTPAALADGQWRSVQVECQKGSLKGSQQEKYRAPGRYVLELAGQGYDRKTAEALSAAKPQIRLLGANLKSVLAGEKAKLDEWLDNYYKR